MTWTKRYHYPGDVEEGYYFDIGTYVCKNHFNDDFLNNYIGNNGIRGICSYCDKRLVVIELEAVLTLIAVGLSYIYEDPLDSRYYNKDTKYGFDGNIQPFEELWWDDPFDLRIEDGKLLEDVSNQLYTDQLYCEKNEFGSHQDYLDELWSHFKEVLKHKARFAFHFSNTFRKWNLSDPSDILHQVAATILHHNMISTLKENTILYRARQHTTENEVTGAAKIASLPNFLNKTAGRMNAAGISLFYCSKNKNVTIKEVVSKKRTTMPYYSTAIFRNAEAIRLVDLTKLPDTPSVFDESNNQSIDIIYFMHSFVEEVSLPVLQKDSILEYLQTQVITEYIRYNPDLNVDGMIYHSAKDSKSKNIVLFYNHEDSLDKLKFSKSSIKTSLVKDL
ncbi:HEPN-associated N-terminal domain-containing protein [uncultured Polaribacter sp.]|uniref:HEPN-associated N-terminal domain-containing protein n=1 Tax=uncultured Polaribacter sp. TaxID=174711 RepID=UPI00262ABE9D|nr:HEPN-associated N-terminal domain-containing protein [uncultured Polaribacter sp.]